MQWSVALPLDMGHTLALAVASFAAASLAEAFLGDALLVVVSLARVAGLAIILTAGGHAEVGLEAAACRAGSETH